MTSDDDWYPVWHYMITDRKLPPFYWFNIWLEHSTTWFRKLTNLLILWLVPCLTLHDNRQETTTILLIYHHVYWLDRKLPSFYWFTDWYPVWHYMITDRKLPPFYWFNIWLVDSLTLPDDNRQETKLPPFYWPCLTLHDNRQETTTILLIYWLVPCLTLHDNRQETTTILLI